MGNPIPSVDQSMGKLVDEIYNIFRNNIPTTNLIGVVLKPPPNIEIKYNNIVLTKKEVYISHYLLAGYRREAQGHLVSATQNRGGGSGYESHNHDINNDYTNDIIYTDTLKAGDLVSIFPLEGNQLFIITDKLVKL
jgi:hypothetical protein